MKDKNHRRNYYDDLMIAWQIALDVWRQSNHRDAKLALKVLEDEMVLLKELPIEKQKKSYLTYADDMIFIFFNEAPISADVDLFWTRIKEAGLPFTKKNPLSTIFKRGSIRGMKEYDVVKDCIVPWFQTGLITEEQMGELEVMLNQFEAKKSRKRGE